MGTVLFADLLAVFGADGGTIKSKSLKRQKAKASKSGKEDHDQSFDSENPRFMPDGIKPW